MAQIAFSSWSAFLNSFKIGDRYIWSIIWFRLQAAFGTLAGVLVMIDPNMLVGLDPKYVAAFVVINAMLSEYLRRRKATEDGE